MKIKPLRHVQRLKRYSYITLPLLLVSAGVALWLPRRAKALNALLLGESEASHLGIDVEGLKRELVFCTALGVGAAVAAAGGCSCCSHGPAPRAPGSPSHPDCWGAGMRRASRAERWASSPGGPEERAERLGAGVSAGLLYTGVLD